MSVTWGSFLSRINLQQQQLVSANLRTMVTVPGDDAVELEFMSKKDSSWRPCKVSVSSDTSTSFGLIVDFGSQDSQEVIVTKEDALERLRIRSVPLHGDECFHIKEGERLLAGQETKSDILFFDAEVKKVLRVRHSKRNQCRCTFEIKWLYLDRMETVTIPASSVMKLAKNTVDNHPAVAEFLNSVKTYDFPDVSSFVSLFEESVLGFDIEKQIEEIGRFADTSRSRSPEDHSLGLRKDAVDLMEKVRHRTIVSQGSFIHDQGPPTQNNSKRTTRSQRKVQVEVAKIPPPSQPFTAEPDRTHLSPLGARAALASLMYKLPSDSEFSASKLTSTISLDLTSKYFDSDISVQDKISIKDGLSNVGVYVDPFDMTRSDVRTSERRDAANHSLQSTVQLNRLGKPVWTPSDTEDMSSEVASVQRSSTQSQSGRKQEILRSATRFTRSAIQKSSSLSNDEVEQHSSPEDIKLCVPMRIPKLTHSTVQKEIENGTVDVSEGVQDRRLAQETGSRFTRSTIQKGSSFSNDEVELKSSSEDKKSCVPMRAPRLTRSTIQKERKIVTVDVSEVMQDRQTVHDTDFRSSQQANQKGLGPSDDELELKTSSEKMSINGPTVTPRLTRSTIQRNGTDGVHGRLHDTKFAQNTGSRLAKTKRKAGESLHANIEAKASPGEMDLSTSTRKRRFTHSVQQKEAHEVMVEVNKGPEENELSLQAPSDSSMEDLVTPQTKETRRRKSLISPDEEINLSLPGESKKQRISHDISITKSEGEAPDASARSRTENNSASTKTKPMLRSSPRQGLLPRTCSQKV